MNKPFFISLDGPKGTGKSSIIQRVSDQLKSYFQVSTLIEKELDPFRDDTKAILTEHKATLTKAVEGELLNLLVKGRSYIGDHYVKLATSDIILIDRWYPSDAVFRKFHTYDECLKMNVDMGVLVPDLIVATTCDPVISLRRAEKRPDGLRSLVVNNLEDQIQTTKKFEKVAETQDWFVLRTEPTLDEVVNTLIQKIKLSI